MEIREIILDTISDLCVNFTYYDRKEDEDLSIKDLEDAIKNGTITIDEMVNKFKEELEQSFK